MKSCLWTQGFTPSYIQPILVPFRVFNSKSGLFWFVLFSVVVLQNCSQGVRLSVLGGWREAEEQMQIGWKQSPLNPVYGNKYFSDWAHKAARKSDLLRNHGLSVSLLVLWDKFCHLFMGGRWLVKIWGSPQKKRFSFKIRLNQWRKKTTTPP